VSRAAPKPKQDAKGPPNPLPYVGPGRPTGERAVALQKAKAHAAAKEEKEKSQQAAQTKKYFANFKRVPNPCVPSPAPVPIVVPVIATAAAAAAAASNTLPRPAVTSGMSLCVQQYTTATTPCHRVPIPSSLFSHHGMCVLMVARPGRGVRWCFGFFFRVSNGRMLRVWLCESRSPHARPRRLATVCPSPHPSFLITVCVF
jgi:hypothetical protein